MRSRVGMSPFHIWGYDSLSKWSTYLVKVSGKVSSWSHISELKKQLYHAAKPCPCYSCYMHWTAFTAFCCLSLDSCSSTKTLWNCPFLREVCLHLPRSSWPFSPWWLCGPIQTTLTALSPLFPGPQATISLGGAHHLRGQSGLKEEEVPALLKSYFTTDPLFFVTPAFQNDSLFPMEIYGLHKTGAYNETASADAM